MPSSQLVIVMTSFNARQFLQQPAEVKPKEKQTHLYLLWKIKQFAFVWNNGRE